METQAYKAYVELIFPLICTSSFRPPLLLLSVFFLLFMHIHCNNKDTND